MEKRGENFQCSASHKQYIHCTQYDEQVLKMDMSMSFITTKVVKIEIVVGCIIGMFCLCSLWSCLQLVIWRSVQLFFSASLFSFSMWVSGAIYITSVQQLPQMHLSAINTVICIRLFVYNLQLICPWLFSLLCHCREKRSLYSL